MSEDHAPSKLAESCLCHLRVDMRGDHVDMIDTLIRARIQQAFEEYIPDALNPAAYEKKVYQVLYKRFNGNKREIAQAANKSLSHTYRRLKELGIEF